VLEKEPDGNWQVIHEHFPQPAENPYGIGDWLKQ
jgi:ketosteroid isomerase-like protein